MPWQQRDIIHFCLILLCVPIQYYISGYFSDVKEEDRSAIIISTAKSLESIKDTILNFNYWTLKWQQLTFWIFADLVGVDNTETGEELQNEDVFEHEDMPMKLTKIRDVRPHDLLYRIGQVVQHTTHAYRGVIVGWEYSSEDTDQPVYTILIDESHLKSGLLSSTLEIEQNKIYAIKNREISHRLLKWFFISYDGSQYIPQDWLREIYPKD